MLSQVDEQRENVKPQALGPGGDAHVFGHNVAPFAFQELRFGFIVINMVSNTFISGLSLWHCN